MKKLKLDLDALAVDSFHPEAPVDAEGTVHGEQLGVTAWLSCGRLTCGGATICGGIQTCGQTCQLLTCGGPTVCGGIQTCGATCLITCGGPTACGGIRTCGITCDHTCLLSCHTCIRTCIPQLCGGPSVFEICP
jgi:hypothetical protein